MNDQKTHWDTLHDESKVQKTGASIFAQKVLKIIPENSKILELGCGTGTDAASFAGAGHNVLATDFSDIAIAKNKVNYSSLPGLTFETLDTQNLSHFLDHEFDVVYAHLSLHYFSDPMTRKIFSEIHRIIRKHGYICFVVKSTKDPLFGKGKKLEENMYEFDGHVRHFFDKKYTLSILKSKFIVEHLTEGVENFHGYESSYIMVIARTKK